VFGLAAIALGMAGLVWGDFATVWHPVRATTPHRVALAYVAAVLFVLGGVAVQWRRTQRAGLIELGILYFIGALLWMPRMIGFPELFGVWSGFAEQFSMVAAVLLTLAASRAAKVRPSAAMQSARFTFGLCVLAFGMAHFTALEETTRMVPAWLPPGQQFWAVVTGGAMLLAGLSLMSGILAVQAAWSMTALIMSFGIFVWFPRLFSAPHQHITWTGNAINLAMAAGAWMVADVLSNSKSPQAHRISLNTASRTGSRPVK
jgi:uncharacterized membrane protein